MVRVYEVKFKDMGLFSGSRYNVVAKNVWQAASKALDKEGASVQNERRIVSVRLVVETS